jgi:hypothetical protein
MPPVMATRPTDLQRWDFLLPRGGWVDTHIPLGDPPGVTTLYNLRVSRDGLETAPGWLQIYIHAFATSLSELKGIRSVTLPSGLTLTFVFYRTAIFMFNPETTSLVEVTPTRSLMPEITDHAPDVVYLNGKLYTVLSDGVYELDPSATSPSFERIEGSPGGKAIGVLGFRLVVGNIVGGTGWDEVSYRIAWSGMNAPQTWDIAQTIDVPTYDPIIRFLPFGDVLLVITPHRFYTLSWTGSVVTPFAITFAAHIPSVITNPLQIQSVFLHDVKMVVYALHDGIYTFSGQESILLNANIFNAYREMVSQYGVPLLGYDPESAELWLYWLNADKAFVYQILFRSWYSRDYLSGAYLGLFNTSANPQARLMFVKMATETQLEFWRLRSSTNVDQRRGISSFTAQVITPVVEVGAVGGLKTTHGAINWWTIFGQRAEVSGNIRMYAVVSNSLPILTTEQDWEEVGTLALSGEQEERGFNRTGRYMRFRFDFDGLTTRIVWHGFSVFWR